MTRLIQTITLLVTLAPGLVSAAHITDKLVVGLYPAPKAEGQPLQLLSSGTPLEVLDRESGFAEVRLADDTTGWVEATYVTEEKPAKAMLLETQARLRQMGLELAKLRGDDAGESARASAETASDNLDLEAAQARISELEAALANERAQGEARKQLAALNEEVRGALDRLAATQGLTLAPVTATETGGDKGRPHLVSWIVSAVALLLGFLGGIAFIDYRIRRRYGGFRI